MEVKGIGGGFFYRSFQYTTTRYNILPSSGDVINPGPWVQMIPSTPTQGRWMELLFFTPSAGATYYIQLGLGALGAEAVWQPTDGIGFLFLVPGAPVFTGYEERTTAFPISIRKQSRISARIGNCNVAAVQTVSLNLTFWG